MTRFSAALQADLDFRLLVLEDMCDSCGSFHAAWGELDCQIAGILGSEFSLQPHVHGGIRHFHPYLPVDTEPPDRRCGGHQGAVQ